MAIKILDDDKDVYLTSSELEVYRNQYKEFIRYHCGFISFEEYVKNCRKSKEHGPVNLMNLKWG